MPKELSKCREWEKERRNRLNDAFTALCKLLPCYDPSVNISKIDILKNAASYVEELQTKIKQLTSENNEESIKKIKGDECRKLQERIKRLLGKNETLCSLLRDAKITIPPGCAVFRKFKSPPLFWSNRILPEQAKILQKNELEKENDECAKKPNRKFTNKKQNKVGGQNSTPKHRKAILNRSEPKKVRTSRKKKIKPLAPSKCVIVLSQPTGTQPCYVITNAPSNNILGGGTSTVIANSNLISNPLVSSKAAKTVSSIPPLGPGTLILANGTIMPVLPQQTVLPLAPQIITRPPIILVPKNPVSVPDSTSSNTSTPSGKIVTSGAKTLARIRPKYCLTKTTQVNKVPIPALTSRYSNPEVVLKKTDPKPAKSKPVEKKTAVKEIEKKAEVPESGEKRKVPSLEGGSETKKAKTAEDSTGEIDQNEQAEPEKVPEVATEAVPNEKKDDSEKVKESELERNDGGTKTSEAETKKSEETLELNINHSELSNDIFASLQVPAGCQNPESTSPTAAFLLAFPLVSSGVKVTEVTEEDNTESQRGTPTLLQIGTMDSTKPTQSESLTPSLLNLDNLSFFSSKDINGFYNSFEGTIATTTTTSVVSSISSTKSAEKEENMQQKPRQHSQTQHQQQQRQQTQQSQQLIQQPQQSSQQSQQSIQQTQQTVQQPQQSIQQQQQSIQQQQQSIQQQQQSIQQQQHPIQQPQQSIQQPQQPMKQLQQQQLHQQPQPPHQQQQQSHQQPLKTLQPPPSRQQQQSQSSHQQQSVQSLQQQQSVQPLQQQSLSKSSHQQPQQPQQSLQQQQQQPQQSVQPLPHQQTQRSQQQRQQEKNQLVPCFDNAMPNFGTNSTNPIIQPLSYQSKQTTNLENKQIGCSNNYNSQKGFNCNNFNEVPKASTTCSYVNPVKSYPEPLYTNSGTYTYGNSGDINFNQNYYKDISKTDNRSYYSLNYENYADYRKNDSSNTYFPTSNYYPNTNYSKEKFNSNTSNTQKNKNSTQSRPPINWMTTPDNRLQTPSEYVLPQFTKEADFYPTNTFTNTQTTYFNTNPMYSNEVGNQESRKSLDLSLVPPVNTYQRNEVEDNQFSWSPTKIPQFLDPPHSFVSSTLPTLVGDLALGNPPAFTEQKGDKCQKKDNRRLKNYEGNQSNFLSVSQLVEHNKEVVPARTTTRRNSGNRSSAKKVPQKSSQRKEKDVFPSNKIEGTNSGKAMKQLGYSGGTSEVFCETKNRNVKNSYSAEALIGHQMQSDGGQKNRQQNYANKPISVSSFLHDNIMPYFPAVDLPQDNTYIQQNQNYQTSSFGHNFPSTFQNNTYTANTFIPTTTITSTYNFMHDVTHDYSDNLNLFPVSKEKNCKTNRNQREQQCPTTPKKSKRKHSNDLPGFVDFPFLSMPGTINSPILPDDFHTHTGFLQPPTPQLYPCKNPFTKPNDVGALLPLPPVPVTRGNIQHPEISPSINNAGTSLTNFNLSTIFPEINNKSALTDAYAGKEHSRSYTSTVQVSFNDKPTFSFSYINATSQPYNNQ